MVLSRKRVLNSFYQTLYKRYGSQHWWPGDSTIEIIVGAILTQNTNWSNVEKAILNLKKHKVLSARKLYALSDSKLATLIKPSGYFNIKAKRIKNFLKFLFENFNGSLSVMEKEGVDTLRIKLISINGIGPETADSILLYAFNKPVFVVDTYTKRILYRHNLISSKATYDDMQKIFTESIEKDKSLYNEYHALIVRIGKEYCKPRANCRNCPLNQISYSLDNVCSQCFRSILMKEKKSIKNGSIICLQCNSRH